MNNLTNVSKYKRLAPVYDLFFGNILNKTRTKVIKSLFFKEGCKILLMGVGTGEDFKHLPASCHCVGIDISEPMLEKAKEKAVGKNIKLIKMNAESVAFPENSYDIVILNLILSVAENPDKVMSEALRVLKDDGRILVFDKFLEKDKKDKKINVFRKIINKITSYVGTDINRCFEDIITDLSLLIIKDEPIFIKGLYRSILITKR